MSLRQRRLRRQLRRLGRVPRAVAHESGLKEWSDAQIARLSSAWLVQFERKDRLRIWRHRLVFLLALVVLLLSIRQFFLWVQQAEAQPSAAVVVVNPWKSYCKERPWLKSCQTKPLKKGNRQ